MSGVTVWCPAASTAAALPCQHRLLAAHVTRMCPLRVCAVVHRGGRSAALSRPCLDALGADLFAVYFFLCVLLCCCAVLTNNRGGRIYGGSYNEMESYLYFCRWVHRVQGAGSKTSLQTSCLPPCVFVEGLWDGCTGQLYQPWLPSDQQVFSKFPPMKPLPLFPTSHRAGLEYLRASGQQPHILHLHEWQTAAVSMLYWEVYSQLGLYRPRVVLTIHNLDNTGECRQDEFAYAGGLLQLWVCAVGGFVLCEVGTRGGGDDTQPGQHRGVQAGRVCICRWVSGSVTHVWWCWDGI
jgi:hypothetical protein